MGQDQRVGRALPLVEQECLRQQRYQAALAVSDDCHSVVGVVVADHRDQRRQSLGGEHHVHPARRAQERPDRIANHVEGRGQAAVPHVGQGAGGVAERAAAFRQVLVQAVAVAVDPLAIPGVSLLVYFSKSPIEWNYGTERRADYRALEEHRIGIRLHHFLVLGVGHAVSTRHEPSSLARLSAEQPNVEAGAQAFLHRRETGADIVDAMNHDDVARQVGAYVDNLVTFAIGLQYAGFLADAILLVWIAHFWLLVVAISCPSEFGPSQYASRHAARGWFCPPRR